MQLSRGEPICSLDEGIEALDYWRSRRERLPWRRRRERREADLMIQNWERRVRLAVLRDERAPVADRLEGGWLVVRTHARIHGRRWRRRLSVVFLTFTAMAGASFAALVGLLF
jgi:hypothetical protein